MNHVEPGHAPGQRSTRPEARRTSRTWWGGAILGLVIGVGAFGNWFAPLDRTDRVSHQEAETRAAAYTRAGALGVANVDPADVGRALASMRLSPVEREELRTAVTTSPGARETSPTSSPSPATAAGSQRLVEVVVWDTHDQDGDVVLLGSAGYRREIALTKTPQTIRIPLNDSRTLTITGLRDGGGGITLGVAGNDPNVRMLMPIMSEGQSLPLALAN